MIELEPYRRHIARMVAERQRRATAEAARIRALLPDVARLLRVRYGARRVGVFGSIATGSFHEASDVDLYVDSLHGDYFVALVELSELLGHEVDLIELDRAAPALVERIAQDGRDLA